MTIEAPRLDPGERLIWSGEPHALRYAIRKSLSNVAIGVPFTIISVAALLSTNKNDPIVLLLGSLFTAIGLALLLSPLGYIWQAKRTNYVLTDKRAIVDITPPFARRLTVLLDRANFVELRKSSAGYGDINFKHTAVSQEQGLMLVREGFTAIADAERVEQLFREAMAQASSALRETT